MKKRRGVLAITVGIVATLGVAMSVMGTAGQLSDEFRPIRANGTWQSDVAAGTWSAELKLDDRSLSGEIVVVGDARFGTGQVRATLGRDGNIEDAELTFEGESLVAVSGRLGRDSLGGSFQIGTADAGEWTGDWYGVPPARNADVAPQESAAKRFQAESAGIREAVDIILPAQTVETNQLANESMDFDAAQVEIEVAVDRSGVSNRVALAAIDAFQFPFPQPVSPDLAYYISPDGGDTWPSSLKGVPPGLEQFDLGADPVIDYDRNGDLYYCGVVWNSGTGNQAIFVSRMPAGTSSFEPAKLVRTVTGGSGLDLDKPWCATGVTPGSAGQDVVYVTWSEYQDPPIDLSEIKVAYSLNAGQSFIGLTTVSDSTPTDPAWPQVAVNPDTKSVNFVWTANDKVFPQPRTLDIIFDRCTFIGAGMALACGADVNVKTIAKPDGQLTGTDFRMSWFPYIAATASSSGYGRIYLVWTEESLDGDTDIHFRSSDGPSINFHPSDERIIANASQDEFFPAVTVDSNFFIRVVYLRRVDSVTNSFNVYSVHSTDGGMAWNAPTQVNDGGTITPVLPPEDDFIGDYIGIDAHFERHPGWMDTRRGNPEEPNFDAYTAVMFGC